ncbi:MAG: 2-methylcitrate dehydratase [Rhodospirillales bacterium]|nr:2-methylcitrate dehydratase [Rhodospirillales bacterium]MDB5380428.1 2-methylcitrate dehydratase [Rhodospirillales bacterium]
MNSVAGERQLDAAGATAKFMGTAGIVLDAAAARRPFDVVLTIDGRPVRETMKMLAG